MRADSRAIFHLSAMNYAESGIPEHLAPFDPVRCLQSIYETVRDGLVILAFDGDQLVGGLGCVEYGIWYSPATLLSERFFYIRPEYRQGTALRAILREARAWSVLTGKVIQLTIANFHKDRPPRNGLERIGDVLSFFPRGSAYQVAPAEKATA
jgi:hypothetical protein